MGQAWTRWQTDALVDGRWYSFENGWSGKRMLWLVDIVILFVLMDDLEKLNVLVNGLSCYGCSGHGCRGKRTVLWFATGPWQMHFIVVLAWTL